MKKGGDGSPSFCLTRIETLQLPDTTLSSVSGRRIDDDLMLFAEEVLHFLGRYRPRIASGMADLNSLFCQPDPREESYRTLVGVKQLLCTTFTVRNGFSNSMITITQRLLLGLVLTNDFV